MGKMNSKEAAKILGVSPTDTLMTIKVALRRKAKTCHPDLYPGDEKKENEFRKIRQAYDTLCEIKLGTRRKHEVADDILDHEFGRWIKHIDPKRREQYLRKLRELEEEDDADGT